MSDSGDDELVDVPAIPRWLRFAAWSVAAVLIAAVAAVVLSRHHGASSATPERPVSPSPVANVPVETTRTDVAMAGDVRWEVRGTTVVALPAGARSRAVRDIRLPRAFGTPFGAPRLVVDPLTRQVWVVLENARASRMVEVSASPPRIVRDVRWVTAVNGAAAYAGHLYLSTGLGVADLAPGGSRPRLVAGLAGAVGPVVPDPRRHRLIAIDLGYPTSLWTFRPNALPVEAAKSLALRESSLAVTDGAIWILGRSPSGAVLERLGPGDLRPVLHATLPAHLGPGTVLLSTGGRALWLTDPLRGDRLVCADASTGRVRQAWRIPGVESLAVERGHALVSTGGSIQRIGLGGCRG